MKIFKAVAVLLSWSIASSIIVSCWSCPDPPPQSYSLSSFNITPLSNEGIMRLIESTHQKGDVEKNPVIHLFRKDFGIEMVFYSQTVDSGQSVPPIPLESVPPIPAKVYHLFRS